ncbi:hypothetical protein KAT92_00425 [Candidatus Babeliales bacterium]|nr:hypothetical protein [Candidatus Babeliales bacterium]
MKVDVKTLKTPVQAEKALTDHRADRAANLARREELNTIIGESKQEMELLEREYQAGAPDENILLRRIGQIAIGE